MGDFHTSQWARTVTDLRYTPHLHAQTNPPVPSACSDEEAPSTQNGHDDRTLLCGRTNCDLLKRLAKMTCTVLCCILLTAAANAESDIDNANVLASLSAGAHHVERNGKHLFRVGTPAAPMRGSDVFANTPGQVCCALTFREYTDPSSRPGTSGCRCFLVDGHGKEVNVLGSRAAATRTARLIRRQGG